VRLGRKFDTRWKLICSLDNYFKLKWKLNFPGGFHVYAFVNSICLCEFNMPLWIQYAFVDSICLCGL
jgi:hypothetical protein